MPLSSATRHLGGHHVDLPGSTIRQGPRRITISRGVRGINIKDVRFICVMKELAIVDQE
jgi:hypothetical protein